MHTRLLVGITNLALKLDNMRNDICTMHYDIIP